jgi:hypothetical protein
VFGEHLQHEASMRAEAFGASASFVDRSRDAWEEVASELAMKNERHTPMAA